MSPTPFVVGRVGTLVPPKTLAPLRTRVHIGTFLFGNLHDPTVSGGFPRRFPGREMPLRRITSITQDSRMSTTGEAARRAVMASTGVAP
ncbi:MULTISPECIES: hypothetical protein [Streptomyces]|jgi:hypothetical protein|uniref:hypothetical protein n=1 Tax=Streptomyces TaxID=1883 RepID=UPI001EFAD652|nr:hypothetical protein [Streptomyces sp. CL12-4]MCG8965790.1 hypothetical protein [Streptomyces sp. CL12-4]